MRISIERRIAGAEKVGEHKTSMLQDVEHGRPLELDALLGPIVGRIGQRSPGANAKLDRRLRGQRALDQSAGFAQAAGLCSLRGDIDEMARTIVVGHGHRQLWVMSHEL